jgi:MoaA/NifB/PqqE/SkfB family radical SAM enzyme|tara:strand:+ start:168 stop:1034 length:867 start_codon:yes stop_codon:yes gene_type:complete
MVTAGWKDLSLEDIKEIHKHTPYITRVNLCGNFGDPAAAPDFFKIVEYFVDNKIRVIISTNGGLRTPFLWASIAGPLVLAQFHIDGDEDTNHMYRVGTRFDKIMANAKGFIDAGGQANWTFIPFAHNEHVIDKCEKIANDMGFISFKVKKTYRVGNNNPGVGTEIELPSEKFMNEVVHKKTETEIRCKVKEDDELYIACDGDIAPCCWVGSQLWRKKYSLSQIVYDATLSTYFIDFDNNFRTNSLTNIINSYIERSDKYELSWEYRKLPMCNKNCGANKWSDRYMVKT